MYIISYNPIWKKTLSDLELVDSEGFFVGLEAVDRRILALYFSFLLIYFLCPK